MAWLSELNTERGAIELKDAPLLIGRGPENDVVLDDDLRVSRQHAEVVGRDDAWRVRDRDSRNGVFVNGTRVTDVELRGGDRIRIGSHEFTFLQQRDPLATLTDDFPGGAVGEVPVLSEREREVLALVAAGATDTEIAQRLTVSLSTVRSHLDRIRDKTGRRRRPDLTRLAGELGLTALPDLPPDLPAD
jgi:pSer/pThr/pTyr-binding forkhead associated (FHA) protein